MHLCTVKIHKHICCQPMENFKLKTFRKPKMELHNFILNNERVSEQLTILLNLREMNEFYLKNGIIDCKYPEVNNRFSTKFNVDWAFEVYKMKKIILQKLPFRINSKVTPVLTRQANNALLLAMIYSRTDIVQYFLHSRLLNINQSVFGSQHWPSYFLLACTCSQEILKLFLDYKVDYNVGWNGLSPYLLTACLSQQLPKTSYLDFITYKQYQQFLYFRDVRIKDSTDQVPIFALDLACMNKDRPLIKRILEAVPEAGSLSRLSFIVQNEGNLFLILSKYNFMVSQTFNGETPLHYSCYTGDLCALTLLLNLGFPIQQNYDRKWPHEVGSERTREKVSVFFNLCTTDVPVNGRGAKKVFNQQNFEEKMVQWMEVLKFNPKDYETYCGIFRYIKYNKNNKVVSNTRFSIVSLFGMTKTPVDVERRIKKMIQLGFENRIYGPGEVERLYERFYG